MALKIEKEGGNTFKVISTTFFYYYFCNYVFLSGQEKSLNFSPVWRPQCFSMGLHKKPKGQENLRWSLKGTENTFWYSTLLE